MNKYTLDVIVEPFILFEISNRVNAGRCKHVKHFCICGCIILAVKRRINGRLNEVSFFVLLL